MPESDRCLLQGQAKKPEDPVIGLTVRELRRIVEKAGGLTGISEKYRGMDRVFSTHSLRHAFATHSYENGMRTLTLMKPLGDEYLGTTQIYVYTAMKYDVEEYVRTNPLRGDNEISMAPGKVTSFYTYWSGIHSQFRCPLNLYHA